MKYACPLRECMVTHAHNIHHSKIKMADGSKTNLRLNTGIDPTSHWTSEQWFSTAGTSVIDRLLSVVVIHLRTKLEIYLKDANRPLNQL